MYNDDRFKFRVWDKQSNSYIKEKKFYIDEFGGLFRYEKSKSNVYINADSPYIMCLCSDRYICEQCTGLKDSNNKLIYENDIVKNFNGDYYLVVWDTNSYLLKYKDGDKLLTDPDYLEVIGNIHENTELLENVK